MGDTPQSTTLTKEPTMRKFTVEIETVNEAFQPTPGRELARLLHELADRLAEGDTFDHLRLVDLNGGPVGRASTHR